MRSLAKAAVVGAACLAAAACGGGEGDGGNASAPAANAASAGGAGAAGAGKEKGARASLLDSLAGASDHSTLANAVKAAGITETLSGAQHYTVFAPVDAAFQKLPQGAMNGLLAPDARGHLTALLTGHIVSGTVTAADLEKAMERGKGSTELATVGGTRLRFAREGDAIAVTDAKGGKGRILRADSAASNGVIHSIDTVLSPG